MTPVERPTDKGTSFASQAGVTENTVSAIFMQKISVGLEVLHIVQMLLTDCCLWVSFGRHLVELQSLPVLVGCCHHLHA